MAKSSDLLNDLLYTSAPKVEEHIVIGDDRVMVVPEALKRIAVQYDHNIETVTFDCPRYWDEHDMSKMAVYINYMLPDGKPGQYIAKNIAVDSFDDTVMHFTWTIEGDVTQIQGNLSVLVCIKKTGEDGNLVNHWNSELNHDMYVSKGLECEPGVAKLYPDIVTQLLLRMTNVEEIADLMSKPSASVSNKILIVK